MLDHKNNTFRNTVFLDICRCAFKDSYGKCEQTLHSKFHFLCSAELKRNLDEIKANDWKDSQKSNEDPIHHECLTLRKMYRTKTLFVYVLFM